MAANTSTNNKPSPQIIDINDIIRDQDTLQVRTEIDPKTVESYARSMNAGSIFPPVTVYRVEDRLFLVDGFHRTEAAEAVAEATMKYPAKISAEVIDGEMGDAIAFAAVANTTNGKQMKKKEYRTSFRMLARSGRLDGMDSRSIAEMMHYVVSHVTIWKWAKEDFPGLLEVKPKKGEKADINRDRYKDSMTKQEIIERSAITGIDQTYKLLFEGQVKDIDALHDIAGAAKGILEKAIELGGDPDYDVYASE